MMWKDVVEISNEIHCLMNREGRILDVNSAFCNILQYNESELIGKVLEDLVETGEKEKLKEVLLVLFSRKSENFKILFINKLGESVLLAGKIVLSSDDQVCFCASVLIQQNALLSRFRRFFDMSLLDIVVIADRAGKILFANEGFSKTLGYSWIEIEQAPLISFIHPQDYEETNVFFKNLIRQEGSSKTLINRSLCKDYRVKWVSWHAIYARNNFYAVGNDITVVKQQELRIGELLERTMKQNEELIGSRDNLQETLAELETRNFELDQFVYKVSHDLRAPLTSILGLVNLSKMDGNNLSNLQEYIELIGSSTLKLDVFIKSLIEYSRTGRAESIIEKVDFDPIIEEIFEHLKYAKNFSRLERTVKIIEKTDFYSDSMRIRIALGNVISNAVKYQNTKAERSYLHITVDFSKPKFVIIILKDNGIGIAEDLVANVFKMFFRATESADGSGLGLYIVKQSIERLNGTIDLQSEMNEGTTITITLPNLGIDACN